MIDVLHEDEQILALDKPEGLATIPGRFQKHCLLVEAEGYLGRKAFVVHRLDKDVSGVILFAKDARTHRYLSMQFEDRRVEKTYVAIVHGTVREDAGVIDRPLRPFGSGRMGVDGEQGKPSETHFVVQQRQENQTVLTVHPVTGRRHQIRVHLYSLGHPILGDPMYGDREKQLTYPRLMLHARAISVRRPAGEVLTITSALPSAFLTLIEPEDMR